MVIKSNHLINEKSPYLLQHAHNPVNWFPWSDEAFDKAIRDDLPVFLSIGYSTCHWCHVMESESFEDEDVAKLMNDSFVSIKVDREERPDIDGDFMTVCQMLTGKGGWPLTIIMTPDKRPFFAATYIPRASRFGMVGMLDLIPKIYELWISDRGRLNRIADDVINALNDMETPEPGQSPDIENMQISAAFLKESYDKTYAGFGPPPKFPTPQNIRLAIRFARRANDRLMLEMASNTLINMRAGGIYDHLGFGFHRYSTDREWLLPHFEKMLYDQALISIAYLEAFQETGNALFSQTAREIFDYVKRCLTSEQGAFYSAEDADSEGAEGKFYTWKESEIRELLSSDNASLFIKTYGIRSEGNYRDEATGRPSETNILHLKPDSIVSSENNPLQLEELDKARSILFHEREKRIRPQRDDKILADWNGLMIAALSIGARVLRETLYSEMAENAARFVMEKMVDREGYLLHRHREGDSAIQAYLDDYSFLAWGMLELYEATFDVEYLKSAIALIDKMIDLFWDDTDGGFFHTSETHELVLTRSKETYDGAMPSGNSVALYVLLKAGRIISDSRLEETAHSLTGIYSGILSRSPMGFNYFLLGLDYAIGPSKELVISGDIDSDTVKRLLAALSATFCPHLSIISRPADGFENIDEITGYTKEMVPVEGKATFYLCSGMSCERPSTDEEYVLSKLRDDD